MTNFTGQRAGNYTITKKLGDGGFATVYLAEHTVLEKKAAVKFLLEEWINEEDVVARFFDEARTMERLKDHPNIVKIIDIAGKEQCQSEGLPPYFIMDFVDGQSLERLIHSDEGFTLEFVIEVVKTALSALEHCHKLGVVHRDIKPSNILIESDGKVKLTDFGIAKAKLNTSKTGNGLTLGSTDYMSPEQALGKRDLDYRTDIYSIGVTLYEMVTGKLPFVGDNPNMVALMHIQEEPPPPMVVNDAVPARLNDVILKAMAKNREDRYQSCAEMVEALEALNSPEPDIEADVDTLDLTDHKQHLPEDDLTQDSDVALPITATTRTRVSEIIESPRARNNLRFAAIFIGFTVMFLSAFMAYHFLSQGTLKIYSQPAGANVFIENVLIGTTPVDLAKPAGKYRIALRYQSLDKEFEPVFVLVDLKARESRVLNQNLILATSTFRLALGRAIDQYEKAASGSAKDRPARTAEAWNNVCQLMKDDDLAVRPDIHEQFLKFALKVGHLSQAESWYAGLLVGQPGDVLLLTMHGRAKELRKDWKNALNEYIKAQNVDANFVPLLNILGDFFLENANPLKDAENAKAYFKHSLYLNPDQPDITQKFERL